MSLTEKLFKELPPHPEHLKPQNYELDHDHHRIVFSGRSIQSINACPLCGQLAHRVHSHYTRRLADLAWADYEIVLQIEVQKFFCDNALCRRRIFTERIPTVMAPWARRTYRLGKQLHEIALQLGGAAGAKMSQKLFCGVSRNTLLRLLMKHPLPTYVTPTTLGVDDFALCKGQTYGTILVDLDQQHPIALLPGRDATGLAEWLVQHPGVQVLSRDRSKAYKSAMSQGAPSAIQVADRFHLIRNLAEVLEQVFRSQISELRRITTTQEDGNPNSGMEPGVSPMEFSAEADPLATLLHSLGVPLDTHYQRRRALHHVIWQLSEQGWSTAAIAQTMGMSIRTVQRDLNKLKFAEAQRRVDYGKNLAHPYRGYILQRSIPGHRCIGIEGTTTARLYRQRPNVEALLESIMERGANRSSCTARFATLTADRTTRTCTLAAALECESSNLAGIT